MKNSMLSSAPLYFASAIDFKAMDGSTSVYSMSIKSWIIIEQVKANTNVVIN